MKKLIKHNDHFYVVDDSQIEENNFCMDIVSKNIYRAGITPKTKFPNQCKITHSSEKLEGVTHIHKEIFEQVVYGYSKISVTYTLTKEKAEKDSQIDLNAYANGILKGFEAHQELVKDKLFTVEDMINAFREGTNAGALHESLVDYDSHDSEEAEEFSETEFKEFKHSLLPKTEWDIEIQEVTTKSEVFQSNDVPYSTFKITIL